MKTHHRHVGALVLMGVFVGLAIAGGPIGFALLVMAGPLILVMIYSARAVRHGSGGLFHDEYPTVAAGPTGAVKADKP
jgi:hypothetical protein